MDLQGIGLFLMLAGYVLGLGAVTVIDIHGFLGRASAYWTEATIRTHKVTKPLIWVGIFLAILGGLLFFHERYGDWVAQVLALVAALLIANGCFLSFSVSPFLVKREKEGKEKELLPKRIQRKIVCSLILSDIGWWGSLALLVYYLTQYGV